MTDELDPEALRRLLEATAALPRSIEPVRDAWPAIRERIEAQRVRPITPGAAPRPERSRSTRWLVAAAVLLIAVSSGVTALLLRGRTAPEVATVTPPAPAAAPTAEPAVPPAREAVQSPPGERAVAVSSRPAISEIYARYDAAADDLAQALASRRSRLDPATVAVLDSCLVKIDAAIAEARAALRRDPHDAVVGQLLSATYRQKLDLLKRAADLPLRRL